MIDEETGTGADMGAKIATALVELPATGGIIDARGFGGTQPWADTLIVNKSVTILLGRVTIQSTQDPILTITSNTVTIRGESRDTLIGATGSATDQMGITIAAGVRDVLIADLAVDGTAKTFTIGDTNANNGIYALGTSDSPNENITIRGCYFSGHNESIRFNYTNYSAILDNTFAYSHAGGQQIYLRTSNYNVLRGNRHLTTGTGSAADALDENLSTDAPGIGNVYAENTIDGNFTAEGVSIAGLQNVVANNTIHLTGTSGTGILIFEPAGNTANQTAYNIVTSNTVILSSNVTSTSRGIALATNTAGAWNVSDNMVRGNIVVNNGTGNGIVVHNYGARNIIEGNYIDAGTGGVDTGDGIIINGANATDNRIINNHIVSAGRYGIISNGSVQTSIIGNTVTHSARNAIHVTGGSNHHIINNYTHDNSVWGYRVIACPKGVVFWGNRSRSDPSGMIPAADLQCTSSW